MTNRDRVLRALKREGGQASGAQLGLTTGLGHRVNSVLRRAAGDGLIEKTDEKDGRSPIWKLKPAEVTE